MQVKKFIARDCELSTTGFDSQGQPIDSWSVTQSVLEQIRPELSARGCRVWTESSRFGSRYSMDCLRQWTGAGQCIYSDMCHVETCTAETTSPRGFAAQGISVLRLAEAARKRAEDQADGDAHLALAASNVDALDPAISWGTHLNVSIRQDLWEDLFVDHAHPVRLAFVASALAAAIPFFGAGYILPISAGWPIYSLSGRAHHLTRIHSLATTEAFRRGVLNSRREPHGANDRLHLIGFDFCVLSSALMASLVQCLLAAVEEGFCGEMLYSPLSALHSWSHGLDLSSGKIPATATLIDGNRRTMAGYIRRLTEKLLAMCEAGLISEQTAPEATEMLPRIIDLTHYVDEGSLHLAARHLDWAAKLMCLLARDEPLGAAGTRLADHDFANTDPQRGLLWRLIQQEQVDPLVTIDQADACLVEPPVESRAWGRGQLIQRFHDEVADVNWSRVELRSAQSYWGSFLRVEMPRLDDFNRDALEGILDQVTDLFELRESLRQLDDSANTISDP